MRAADCVRCACSTASDKRQKETGGRGTATRFLLDALRPPRARRKPNSIGTHAITHNAWIDGRMYCRDARSLGVHFRLFRGNFLPPANPPISCPTSIRLGYLPQVFHRKRITLPRIPASVMIRAQRFSYKSSAGCGGLWLFLPVTEHARRKQKGRFDEAAPVR